MKFEPLPLIIGSLLFSLGILLAREELPFGNPIPEPIEQGDLTLHLELFVTMPQTSEGVPKARINSLKPAVDGSDRVYVNDLRGQLYAVDEGEVRIYLNVRNYLPDFDDSRGLGGGLNSFAF
ncbi:MAG: hypothetical protein O7C75_07040, partial [Verrucomicrobia bacterium]|nr:hypothetical protein [Verrucomicrobiota bacterium]